MIKRSTALILSLFVHIVVQAQNDVYIKMPDNRLNEVFAGEKIILTEHFPDKEAKDEKKDKYTIRIWDNETKELLNEYLSNSTYGIISNFIELENGNICYKDKKWDKTINKEVKLVIEINTKGQIEKEVNLGSTTIQSFAVDPKGKYLFVMPTQNVKETRMYTFEATPKLLHTVTFTPEAYDAYVGFFNDGDVQYALFYDNYYKNTNKSVLCKIENNKIVKVSNFKNYVSSVHPDQKILISYKKTGNSYKGPIDKKYGLQLYSMPSLQLIKESACNLYTPEIRRELFSPDAKNIYLVTSTGEGLMQYNIELDSIVAFLDCPISVVGYSPDKKHFLYYTMQGDIMISDMQKGVYPYKAPTMTGYEVIAPLYGNKTMRIYYKSYSNWGALSATEAAKAISNSDQFECVFRNSVFKDIATIKTEISVTNFKAPTEKEMKSILDSLMKADPKANVAGNKVVPMGSTIFSVDGRPAGSLGYYYYPEKYSSLKSEYHYRLFYIIVDKNIKYIFGVSGQGNTPNFEAEIIDKIYFVKPLSPHQYLPKK